MKFNPVEAGKTDGFPGVLLIFLRIWGGNSELRESRNSRMDILWNSLGILWNSLGITGYFLWNSLGILRNSSGILFINILLICGRGFSIQGEYPRDPPSPEDFFFLG